jgi:hypothetical protein
MVVVWMTSQVVEEVSLTEMIEVEECKEYPKEERTSTTSNIVGVEENSLKKTEWVLFDKLERCKQYMCTFNINKQKNFSLKEGK